MTNGFVSEVLPVEGKFLAENVPIFTFCVASSTIHVLAATLPEIVKLTSSAIEWGRYKTLHDKVINKTMTGSNLTFTILSLLAANHVKLGNSGVLCLLRNLVTRTTGLVVTFPPLHLQFTFRRQSG